MTEDGGAIVTFGDEPEPKGVEFNDNLAEYLDETEIAELASTLIGDFESDKMSRKDWEDTYVRGLGSSWSAI